MTGPRWRVREPGAAAAGRSRGVRAAWPAPSRLSGGPIWSTVILAAVRRAD